MVRKTIDPQHEELKAVLDGLLERNEDMTARAVTRLHSSIKNASGIVRHPERRQILEQYQTRQRELRAAVIKLHKSGPAAAAAKLQTSTERVRELEQNEAARVASHLAMIHVIAEMGGTAKLQQFYKRFANIRDSLVREGSLPAQFLGDLRSQL